jgi:hypothetical protein
MKSFKNYITEYNQQANQPIVLPPANITPTPKRNIAPSQMPPNWNPYFQLNNPMNFPGRRGWRPPEVNGYPAPYPNGWNWKDPRSPTLA